MIWQRHKKQCHVIIPDAPTSGPVLSRYFNVGQSKNPKKFEF